MENKVKRAILSSFKTPETHPTEDELLASVNDEFEVTSAELKTTLLELLNKKEIYSLKSSDKKVHYGKQKGSHYHFICNDCGKVRDFLIEEGAYNMMNHYVQKIVHSYGIIDKINLSVHGTCHDCK